MGNAFADLAAIKIGEQKAQRDIDATIAYYAEHDAKHDADPEYECGGDAREFWGTIGMDVMVDDDNGTGTDYIVEGAYKRKYAAWREEYDKTHPSFKTGIFQIDPDKIDPDNPFGSIMGQVIEQARTQYEFQKLVNPDTDDEQNGDDK